MSKAPRKDGVADQAGFLFNPDSEIAAPSDVAPAAKPLKARAADPALHYLDHRERLRKRFAEAGASALADYELIELLLFRTIPRRDTKPLAKALIARFGHVAGVLAADPARIAEVPGAGPAVALDLKAIQATLERAMASEVKKRPVVSTWSALLAYCKLAMANETREQFRVLFLDRKNQVIADEVQNIGTVDQAPIYPREIIAAAEPLGVGVHDHLVIGRAGAASFKTLGLI